LNCGYYYKAQYVRSIKAYRKGGRCSRSSCADQGIEDKGEGKKMMTEEEKVKNNKITGYGQKRREGEEKK
jgi:hypothetical protein